MYSISVEFPSLNKVLGQISDISAGTQEGILSAMGASVEYVTELLRENVPVDTGNLKDSVVNDIIEAGPLTAGYIGIDLDQAHYAPFVELGHHTPNGGFVPGQYFLRNTAESSREQVFEIFERTLADELLGAVR